MPRAVSDVERQLVIDLLPSGRSCNSIAKEIGRSPHVVSKIAKSVGHDWACAPLARACAASKAYGSEWRADFGQRLAAKCDDLLKEMDSPCLVHSFGGKDNEYSEHLLDCPPIADKERLMKSMRLAIQTIMDIARHDSDGGMGMAAVDEWLKMVKGDS